MERPSFIVTLGYKTHFVVRVGVIADSAEAAERQVLADTAWEQVVEAAPQPTELVGTVQVIDVQRTSGTTPPWIE